MENRKLAWRAVIAGTAGIVVLAVYTAFIGPNSTLKIQGRLQAKADAALVSANLTTWKVEARGASIDLEGVAPSDEEKRRAIEAVRQMTGIASVRSDRVVIAPHADPFEWIATKEGGRITLQGHGPTRSSLTAIHDTARKLYGSDMQDDATLASGAPAGVDWDVAAIKGLEALVKLQRGTATLRGKELVVQGLAASDADARSILSWLNGEKGGAKVITNIVGPAEWFARVEDGRIVLHGKVASKDAQSSLLRAAGGSRVAEDKTYIGSTGDWQARARAALPLLAQFEQGELAVQDKAFRITGAAPASVLVFLREDMGRIKDGLKVEYNVTEVDPDVPELGGVGLRTGRTGLDACQAAFNRIMSANRISFANGRATMERSSGKALDLMVAALRACPSGNVEIEGHTDASGDRRENVALSRDRARTVMAYLVARGVSADRLSAVGFGPDRPIASNRTDSGKARNRRIEFRVTRGESN
jgi:OmpA-OmpF porin, OOP family